MSLVVVGSVAFDTIETPHGRVAETPGGSALHFSLAAALLTKVRLVGVVGQDLSREHVDMLAGRGVDVEGIQRKKGKTFRWSGRYSQDMNQRETLAVELNVFGEHRPEVPEAYRDSKFVFLANGSPLHQEHVLDQMAGPEFTMVDTMDHWIHSNRADLARLLKRVQAIVINDGEARLLAGESSVAGARRILEMGPRYVVIKKGEHGAMMATGREVFLIPAYPSPRVKDPTGAGDTFAGGLMGHLASVGKVTPANLRRAIAYGTVLASFNVEDFGVRRVAALTIEELEARMDEFRKMLEF